MYATGLTAIAVSGRAADPAPGDREGRRRSGVGARARAAASTSLTFDEFQEQRRDRSPRPRHAMGAQPVDRRRGRGGDPERAPRRDRERLDGARRRDRRAQRARTPPEAATEGRSTPPGLDLVFVGRLVPVKQADVLIEAVVGVPAARLTIVGDGPELERLEALARELAVTDRVTFTGALGHDDVMLQLARADALVLASSHEGLPHVLHRSARDRARRWWRAGPAASRRC